MTDLAKGSFEDKTAIAHAIDLLTHYSFDMGDRTAPQLTDEWLKAYPAGWIRWAVIEALYQGRYKAISAEQILQLWQRRQQPCYHFSYEFERLVCHKFPRNLSQPGLRKPILPTEIAVLPALPAPAVPNRIETEELPWLALAEQILQQEDPTPPSNGHVESVPQVEEVPTEPLEEGMPLRSLARIQSGVEALIEQATSNLNASTEALTTRLRANGHLQNGSSSAEFQASEEPRPPIHQFTPTTSASEFHSKLRSVVEHPAENLEDLDRP
jgi:hypothetical protein